MSDIVKFLRARLDDDEERARFVDSQTDEWAKGQPFEGWRLSWWDEYDLLCIEPSRALREVEAKRDIIDDYLDALRCAPTDMSAEVGRVALLCALRALAGVYSDHPDYREEWRA